MIESVDKRWYIGYTWWIVLSSVSIVAVRVAGFFIPYVNSHLATWGIEPSTVTLAAMALIYRMVFYNKQAEKRGLSFATFALSLMQIANSINLMNLTGWTHSWYIAVFFIMIFFSGISGIFPTLGASLLLCLFVLISIPNIPKTDDVLHTSILVISGFSLCVISYLVWRGHYIDGESEKVNRLNSVVKSKQKQAEILIQSIADGVIVTDTEGHVSLMNPSASKMTQWPVEEAINIDVRSIVKLTRDDGKPLESNENPFSEVFVQKKNLNQTLGLRGREGKQQIVSLIVSPVVLPTTKELVGSVAVIRDISNEKKLEKQRADFISTASHEMRTPVAAIEGYLALAMNSNVSKIDAKARDYLEKAHTSTQRLGKLFQDLLTSAKAEDGRLSSHPVVVDMSHFIEQLADDLRFGAQKKGLKMELLVNNVEGNTGVIDASGSTAKTVQPIYYTHVDPDRIREAITNVFDNAVKYTEQGRVSLAITGNDEVVQIRITDTGSGIPAEDIPHLFQKFYRVDNTTTRAIGGTGLGLFICRKIIELYGGTIWAESTPGKGSAFYINLPRLSANKAIQLQREEASTIIPGA